LKRPLRVRVLGKRFTVEWCDEGNTSLDDCYGIADSANQKIYIQTGLPVETEQDTVLHEVMHCIEEAMGLDLDEMVIKKMATGILAVIKDNHGFATYLRASK